MWKTFSKILKNVHLPQRSCVKYSSVRQWGRQSNNNHRYKSGDQNGLSWGITPIYHINIRSYMAKKLKRRQNDRFEKFLSEVNERSDDFVLSDEQWDSLRKDIINEDEDFAKGLDFSIMFNLNGKPDLSLSYMTYLRKNMGTNTSTMTQFCVNCVDKYEDSVMEVIRELNNLGYFDRSSKMSFEKFHGIVLKTKEWKLCLNSLKHVHEGRRMYLFVILKAALRHKDYKTFLEIWNQFSHIISLYGKEAGEWIFQSWEECEYPLDLLFEVSKLAEIPFTNEQAITLMKYCRKQWQEVVEAKIARVSISRGQCLDCNNMMPLYSPMSVEKIKDIEKALINDVIFGRSIYEKTHPSELKRFFQFMEKQEKPFDLVVDALNVRPSFKMHRGMSNSFDGVKNLANLGWNILIVTKKTGVSFVQEWNRYAQVFDTAISSIDDLYFLLATLMSGPNCYLLTSDQLRDHASKLDPTIRGDFCKWLEQRKVYFKRHMNTIVWPAKHQWRVHETDLGWHIPYVKDAQTSSVPHRNTSTDLIRLHSRSFLCLKKKQYEPSEECLHFRQVKDSFITSTDIKTEC